MRRWQGRAGADRRAAATSGVYFHCNTRSRPATPGSASEAQASGPCREAPGTEGRVSCGSAYASDHAQQNIGVCGT